jgi:thiol-disulfide isomerase/thioredoxin
MTTMSRDRPPMSAAPGEARKRWLRVLPVLVVAILGVAVLSFATFGTFHRGARRAAAAGFPMPTFRLPVLDGGLLEGDTTFLSSDELKGHVVLLEYWATSCKPCIAEQPLLMELQDDYGDGGLRVVGVLDGGHPASAFDWLQGHHRERFLTVVGDERVARAGHVAGLPETLLVARNGQVIARFEGYSKERDPYLRQRVRELTTKR